MNHMELVGDGETICNRCGNLYDWRSIEAPENATIYWVPSCPNCNAKMTANPSDKIWLNIIGSDLDKAKDYENGYEYHRAKVHAHARLYHGRMVDISAEELIRRAKWFDRQASRGTAYGPRHYRDIAFNLRRQARQKT